MLTFNADLFRIAYMGASTEETRYYLCGVFIQPAAGGGATLTSTDGHTLVCLCDPDATGVPESGVILQTDKPPAALFRTPRKELKPRLVRWDGHVAHVYTSDKNTPDGYGDLHGAVPMRAVDGSFPEWRRVVPSLNQPDDDVGEAELVALLEFAKEGEGFSDWPHGEVFVRDSYFETYARELADDLGLIRDDAVWPATCIDWEQAARELRMDYSSAEFDGVTYWARA